jgi:hypothetical protein
MPILADRATRRSFSHPSPPPFSCSHGDILLGAQQLRRALVAAACCGLLAAGALAQPAPVVDLAGVTLAGGLLHRVWGAEGSGRFGLPVAGPGDLDGDGLQDYAVAFMTALPGGNNRAGEVDLIFGDGTISGGVDTAMADARVLRLLGEEANETTGSEIWIDDVTGDGLADLLVCRQNYSRLNGRLGAGALTIVAGSAALRTQATTLTAVDLGAPPAGVALTHIVGAAALDRLCIWARTGDVTGDGIADIVVAADQRDALGESNRGAVYVLRGGAYLSGAGVLDLAASTSAPLAGNVAEITPPLGSDNYHFGATCQVADLNGNGRAEVLAAAALNRAGAGIDPPGSPGAAHSSGGAPHGHLYIAWDDNFPAGAWPNPFRFQIDQAPGSYSALRGEPANISFGEEILGGRDYDNDGRADLFIGDLVGDGTLGGTRPTSGIGYLYFNARRLKGLDFEITAPPVTLRRSRILGPATGALGADTAADGDFDGDSADDLAFASPHARPLGRTNAGQVHILFGRSGGWPEEIDLADGAQPPRALLRLAEIQGANGQDGSDRGDTLAYSAAAGDVDGDGRSDLITNEMVGNGVAPGAIDVGNLIVVSGAAVVGESLFTDGFNGGSFDDWDAIVPSPERRPATARRLPADRSDL